MVVLSINSARPVVGPAETEMFPEADATVLSVMSICPEPERVMFPAAVRLPVGVMLVPPEMDRVPLEAVMGADPT
jgi:hypothetical protein